MKHDGHDDPPSPSRARAAGSRSAIQAAKRQELRRSSRRWPRRLLFSGIALVLIAGILVVGGYVYYGYRFDQIAKVHTHHLVKDADPAKPFNVLIVGSDSRQFETNAAQASQFGSASTEGGQRSDVTIVARFVPATRQVFMMSIPRDLWVDIPGHSSVSGMNRINAAFDSGPDLLIETIEHDLHIPINHYVAVNFDGFQQMVNALGGISLDFPTELRDNYSQLYVTSTGCQPVSGAEALALVRSRHMYYKNDNGYWEYDGLSDFSRIQRQDVFFRAVLDKVGHELTNPFAMNGFIDGAVHSLKIDDTITKGDLLRWGEEFHGVTGSSLQTMTLPTTSYLTGGGADALKAAEPYANQMIFTFNLIGVPPKTAPHATMHASFTTTSTTTGTPTGIGTGSGTGDSGASHSSTSTSTTTTIPGNVYTNTQPEPFNPTTCSS